jgi:hypothetical protein
MEVHHHSHSKSNKWTHYFWEFLMLFLAVFLGFLTENQREHFIEHNREKQFLVSLKRDLELDTLQFDRLIQFRNQRLSNIDSLMIFFVTHEGSSIPGSRLKIIFSLFGHSAFYQNSGTMDQLKNSGGLRLIRKRIVVDSIDAYDQQIRRMGLRDKYETDYIYETGLVYQRLFNGVQALKLFTDSTFFHKKPNLETENIAFDKARLGEYLNRLISFRIIVQGNLSLQQSIKKKARNLIRLIKEEYHLN